MGQVLSVTPCMGAGVETKYPVPKGQGHSVAPRLWVRELKYGKPKTQFVMSGRTPYGCVS